MIGAGVGVFDCGSARDSLAVTVGALPKVNVKNICVDRISETFEVTEHSVGATNEHFHAIDFFEAVELLVTSRVTIITSGVEQVILDEAMSNNCRRRSSIRTLAEGNGKDCA